MMDTEINVGIIRGKHVHKAHKTCQPQLCRDNLLLTLPHNCRVKVKKKAKNNHLMFVWSEADNPV